MVNTIAYNGEPYIKLDKCPVNPDLGWFGIFGTLLFGIGPIIFFFMTGRYKNAIFTIIAFIGMMFGIAGSFIELLLTILKLNSLMYLTILLISIFVIGIFSLISIIMGISMIVSKNNDLKQIAMEDRWYSEKKMCYYPKNTIGK